MKNYIILTLLCSPCLLVLNESTNIAINLIGLIYCVLFGLFLTSQKGRQLMRNSIKEIEEINKKLGL